MRPHLHIVALVLAAGCSSGPDAPGPPPCDEVDDGPASTPVVEVLGPVSAFEIDATEVTAFQYARFLAAVGGETSGQPAVCSWNTSYEDPACLGEDRDRWAACGKLPQVCVDWCDARAYCEWAGKRLCGDVIGGPEPADADHRSSQWIAACSAGGRNRYVWGLSYDEEVALACNGVECATVGDDPECLFTAEVATHPDCQSPVDGYRGVFDLYGNVNEWVDRCDGAEGASDPCSVRGGSSFSGGPGSSSCLSTGFTPRDRTDPALGFRCCSL